MKSFCSSRPLQNLASTGLLITALTFSSTSGAETYDYFWSAAIANTKADFGSESNGFGGNNELAQNPNLKRHTPKDSSDTSYLIRAGQYFGPYRAYVQYHLRPSGDTKYDANGNLNGNLHDVWSFSGNLDVTTHRHQLISGFAGVGIGIAGVYWQNQSRNEFDDQSLALSARAGFMLNPRDNWFAELGVRFEKTNLQVNALDNSATANVDESITLPQVDLKSNHGAYLAIGVNF